MYPELNHQAFKITSLKRTAGKRNIKTFTTEQIISQVTVRKMMFVHSYKTI